MERQYNAHFREEDGQYQSVLEHSKNVARLAEGYCAMPLLKKAARLAGLLHDAGKVSEQWQQYFDKSVHEGRHGGEKLDHSTAGGAMIARIEKPEILREMVEHAIYMHHGLADCISLRDGTSFLEKRRQKTCSSRLPAAEAVCGLQREEIVSLWEEAAMDFEKLSGRIKDMMNLPGYTRGNMDFYLGMCERMLFSALIDADWRDTADFMEGAGADAVGDSGSVRSLASYSGVNVCPEASDNCVSAMDSKTDSGVGACRDASSDCDSAMDSKTGSGENACAEASVRFNSIRDFWEAGVAAIERDLAGLSVKTALDPLRAEISAQCRDAADTDQKLYRLAVPTGAGKTKGSLRFAFHHALKYGKRHIFYVAPFRSILEQNAKVIREILQDIPGADQLILEHHSDVICDSQGAEDRYERLIENWDEVPVIVTTAVQFFHTLFKERRSNIRRFHSLCDSVIIMDEVQALPVKLVHLFNLSINFLTRLCNTTVVLCTATQPLFHEVKHNRMDIPADMTGGLARYETAFRRVEYHDCCEDCKGGLSIEEAADFLRERAGEFRQILMIVNTKSCARKIYEQLKGNVEGKLFHLSNSMCSVHKAEVLEDIRKTLECRDSAGQPEPMICITTQLVEAGVDFSFQCVVRSMAGLDNLIQAAGRCNRHGAEVPGHVYLVKMSQEAENISALKDICEAREAMRQLLHKYHANPANFDHRLDSEKAIEEYYRIYFYGRKSEMSYAVKAEGLSVDLVSLLSCNQKLVTAKNKGLKLKQAFSTAGRLFEVIEESGGQDVAVLYGDAQEWLDKLQEGRTMEERKEALRRLQGYTVKLSEGMLRRLEGAVDRMDEKILVLKKEYYSRETGVTEEPGEMEFLGY